MKNIYTCPILNTNIAVTDMKHTVTYLTDNLETLRGKYICVSNVHTTVMSFKDTEYRAIQNGAALALPDGKPLSVVSRRRGFRNARRVPGPDLMLEMFKQPGYRHFFYGSKEETLEMLKDNLLKMYPDLNIAGMYAPPFRPLSEEEDAEDIKKINDARPDFIWVGLGAPKQEKWMASHQDKVNGIMLGVGAGFDFHAGTVKRAPKWMQELCLEWFYRLIKDPRRLLKRYLSTNLSFIWNTTKEGHRVKKQVRKEHLKIAMIGHKRIPSREGGVEIVVDELSKRMVDKGCFVEAYNRRGSHVSGRQFVENTGKDYEGIRIITVPTFETKSLNAIVYSFFATIRALFGGYDVIHFHAEGPCIMLPLAHFFGNRTVATIHGLDWQRSKWGNFATRMLKYGEKCAAKYADEIIVLSENVKQYFMDTYNRETTFIPNGIVKPNKLEANEMTTLWGLKKDEYILFLARIVPEKGAHYLIDAYKKLYEENPELPRKKLVIAGGSSHSSEYYKKLIEMAQNDQNIVFTNFVGGDPLVELYSNAYMFVLPSDIEGMAMSLLEAMSYGNCCLVSDISENVSVVGDHGATFAHGDESSLMQQLKLLIENEKLKDKYAGQASEYILNRYDWDTVTDETIKMYNKIK